MQEVSNLQTCSGSKRSVGTRGGKKTERNTDFWLSLIFWSSSLLAHASSTQSVLCPLLCPLSLLSFFLSQRVVETQNIGSECLRLPWGRGGGGGGGGGASLCLCGSIFRAHAISVSTICGYWACAHAGF